MHSRSLQSRTRVLFRTTIKLQHRTYLNGFKLSRTTAVKSPTIIKTQNTQNSSKIWNFLSKRYYGADGSGYKELSKSAFKETRFYRYYKFSDKVDVQRQQRGHFAAVFVIFTYILVAFILFETSFPISNHYTHTRRMLHACQERFTGLTGREKQLMMMNNLAKYDQYRLDQQEDTQNLTRQEYLATQTQFEVDGKGKRQFFTRHSIDALVFPGMHPENYDLQRTRYQTSLHNQAYKLALQDAQNSE